MLSGCVSDPIVTCWKMTQFFPITACSEMKTPKHVVGKRRPAVDSRQGPIHEPFCARWLLLNAFQDGMGARGCVNHVANVPEVAAASQGDDGADRPNQPPEHLPPHPHDASLGLRVLALLEHLAIDG